MVDALSLCHGCLSADRELSPICQFSDMFTMICQRKVRVPGMTDIYFCWECTATLKRIQTFNMQVNKAQDKLRLYIRKKDNLLPKSLSKLNTSKTNHDFISFTETEIEIKKEDYSDFSDAHNDEEELQEDPTSIDDLKDIEQCVTESEIKIKNEDDSDFSNAPNEAEELKPDPSFIVDLKDLKEKPQNERLRYYDHISTAEEMCVKEQARQSDLVHFWVGHGCHPQGYDASSTMCMESEDHLKAEFSKNENIETYNSNHNEISKKSESKPRKRGSTWDEDSLRRAMEAVQNNQLNTNAAALKFNIPRRTLRNHLLSGNSTKIIGKTTILTKQQEEDLSQRIKRFAKLGVPLTPKFISKQAFLFCESFKIKNSFNTSTRMAGRKWLKMFLSRNPSISNGNKATGLYPFDPDVIPEDAYAPSIVTERPLSETLLHQIDQPLISVQVSPPMSEFKEVSELSSQSLVDERSADVSDVSSIFPSTSKETSPKFSTATPKRKPVLVSCSSSKDVSDLELVTVSGRFNVADTKHDPQTSLYDNPLPSTSGLELNRLKRKVQKQNSKSLKIEKKKSVMVLPVSEPKEHWAWRCSRRTSQ